MSSPEETIALYDRLAAAFAERFEASSSEAIWSPVQDLLPTGAGRLALDVGAGSGRDAAWLASLGMTVVAAEPAAGLRVEGMARHPEAVRWIDDRLPELTATHRLGLSFDLALVNAVWMHLPLAVRPRAFRKIATLLKPGGVMLMTLRSGPIDAGRTAFPVSLGEIEGLARDHGLTVLRVAESLDRSRPEVEWKTVCLRLADDGAAGLPLVRGIVLNDDKSSTYKLGLLRAVAKIADAAPSTAEGAAGARAEDLVALPMGLVALNWLRLYLPLVAGGLPQAPGNSGPDGLGFAKEGFRALLGLGVTAQDLRIGASFAGDRAAALIAAIADARRTIIAMPMRHITLPNGGAEVFRAEGRPTPVTGAVTLTPEVLRSWGRLILPGPLWRTLQRFGCWIEPVVVGEWARLMRRYAERMGLALPPGAPEATLAWLEPSRDTGLARLVAGRLGAAGAPIRCVWSDVTLDLPSLDVDHALPWSAFPCGDLWNLLPSARRVNQHQKRDRLPSQAALAAAREPILAWWRMAWTPDAALATRFAAEAQSALPIDGEASPDAVFDGLEWRRLRLRQDQQAPEWPGLLRRPTGPG